MVYAKFIEIVFVLQEIKEHFMKYMANVRVGIITNAHTAFAGKEACYFLIVTVLPKTAVLVEISCCLHCMSWISSRKYQIESLDSYF